LDESRIAGWLTKVWKAMEIARLASINRPGSTCYPVLVPTIMGGGEAVVEPGLVHIGIVCDERMVATILPPADSTTPAQLAPFLEEIVLGGWSR